MAGLSKDVVATVLKGWREEHHHRTVGDALHGGLRLHGPSSDSFELMLSFAKSRVFINGFGGGGSGSSVGYGLGKPHQYDEKTMVEIYRSMIAQGQLAVTSHNSVVMV
ncbi:hypothetical protein C5167_023907 [Papaver somniferum]|uniref:Uncharacterized protein n=1 Tax=Papaver somniferum TaxID=3469 RepID=A0A4Y7JQV1_PAPSO|nr:hypothetical protein C5167_023907 [Papaver somniferum]